MKRALALAVAICLVPVAVEAGGGVAERRPGFEQGAFVAMAPIRVVDTRIDAVPLASGERRRLDLAGVVPAGATVVALNVTAVDASAPTFLTLHAGGQDLPPTSNLNLPAGATRATAAIVALGPGPSIEVANDNGSVHLLVDVTGYADGSLVPVRPQRLVDTRLHGDAPGGRPLGQSEGFDVRVAGVGGVPASVEAVIVTVTAVDASDATFLTVAPAGFPRPVASNLNLSPGDTRANLAVVRPGAVGDINIHNDAGDVHVLVDIVGYIPSGASYRGVQPARLADTRVGAPTTDGLVAGKGPLSPGEMLEIPVLGRGGVWATATAVSVNVTAVALEQPGFVSVRPCPDDPTDRGDPPTSTVNLAAGEVVANAAILGLGRNGALCVVTSAPMHVLVDVFGHHLDSLPFGQNGIVVNTRPSRTDFAALDPWIDGIGYLRVWGGSRGMATYPTLAAVPPFLRDQPSRHDVVQASEIEALLELQRRHGVRIVYMVNVNDTLASQSALIDRLLADGLDVAMLELGNELYLPKFRSGDTSQLGVTRSWTPEQYVSLLRDWVPELRRSGLPIFGIGASHGPSDSVADAYRRGWNTTVGDALAADPGLLDGITFHLYVGEERDGLDPDEKIDDEFLGFLETFGDLQIAITESGHQFSTVTPENLARSERFWSRVASALKPGDVFGVHVLYETSERTRATGYALFDEGGRTAVGDRLAAWLASP